MGRGASRRGRPRAAAGFTLLELLLAITLLGLIAVLLAGGIGLGARVWERGEETADELAQLEVVQGFLRRQLSHAYPLRLRLPRGDTRRHYAFEGEPRALRFAVLAPPQFGLGGFYILSIDDPLGEEGRGLRLRARLYHPEMEEEPHPDEVTETMLLEGFERAEFSYYGTTRRGQEPEWHESWEGARSLPLLVRLRIEFAPGDERYWPELVVAPQVSR